MIEYGIRKATLMEIKMDIKEAITKLKHYISDRFEETKVKAGPNITRGHFRALSTEIEDGIAIFLLDILPVGYKAFVDCSVNIDGESHRPDILVLDENNRVRFLVEVKTNMGWCRDASSELGKILHKHERMKSIKDFVCKFSNYPEETVRYPDDVKVYLVPFTNSNASDKKHEMNKIKASEMGIKYYKLFDNWYWNLEDKDITAFAKDILS